MTNRFKNKSNNYAGRERSSRYSRSRSHANKRHSTLPDVQRCQGPGQVRYVRQQRGPNQNPHNSSFRQNFHQRKNQNLNQKPKFYPNNKYNKNCSSRPIAGFNINGFPRGRMQSMGQDAHDDMSFCDGEMVQVHKNEAMGSEDCVQHEDRASHSHSSDVMGNFGEGISRDGDSRSEQKVQCNPINLSYEDITDNSENEESDLRQHLLRRKHEQIVKREPGELDSDEDNETASSNLVVKKPKIHKKEKETKSGKSEKPCYSRKQRRLSPGKGVRAGPANRSTPKSPSPCSSSRIGEKSSSKTVFQQQGPGTGGQWDKGCLLPRPDTVPNSTYDNHDHDNRCAKGRHHRPKHVESQGGKRGGSDSGSFNESEPLRNYCCPEAEIADLRDNLGEMKRVLRETRDKLLEAKVIGSKKAIRMQEEIDLLKEKMNASASKQEELKSSLKDCQNELISKRAEVSKMSKLYEVEKQERAKAEHDLTRTYQDRLTIEIDKLRALFDIEVAKMQAFYISQTGCFDDNSIATLLKGQNQEIGPARTLMQNLQHSLSGNLSRDGNNAGSSRNSVSASPCSERNSQNSQFLHRLPELPTQSTSTSDAAAYLYRTGNSKYSYNNVVRLQNFCASSNENADDGVNNGGGCNYSIYNLPTK